MYICDKTSVDFQPYYIHIYGALYLFHTALCVGSQLIKLKADEHEDNFDTLPH